MISIGDKITVIKGGTMSQPDWPVIYAMVVICYAVIMAVFLTHKTVCVKKFTPLIKNIPTCHANKNKLWENTGIVRNTQKKHSFVKIIIIVYTHAHVMLLIQRPILRFCSTI